MTHPSETLTDRLGIRYPILQGGMTFGSDGRLVAAVCRSGGLGTLGTFHYRTYEEVAAQLAVIREATDRPFAVNVPFFHDNIELVRRAAADGVRIFTLGGWCSPEVIALKETFGLTLLVSLNSPTIARTIEPYPVDCLIAQGNESGGANSHFTTRQLFDYLSANHPQPVVLAGGLWDGLDLYCALKGGAAGIQLGTRFFFSAESPLHPSIKQRVVDQSRKRPITTQLVPVTDTLKMRFVINKPLKQGLRLDEIREIFTDKEKVFDLSAQFFDEQEKSVLIYAGAGVHNLREVQPCNEIVREIVERYDGLLLELGPELS